MNTIKIKMISNITRHSNTAQLSLLPLAVKDNVVVDGQTQCGASQDQRGGVGKVRFAVAVRRLLQQRGRCLLRHAVRQIVHLVLHPAPRALDLGENGKEGDGKLESGPNMTTRHKKGLKNAPTA